MKKRFIALAVASLFGTAMAADRTVNNPSDSMRATAPVVRPAERNAAFTNEKDMLEQKLKAGTDRASYKKIIEANGYRVSAINADKPDYLEYEIVKGTHSLEVQLDFKDGAHRATGIDVTSNMWRADSTKRMEKDNSYKSATPMVADPTGKYSDRRYMKEWTSEKERLQAALPPNMKVADYKTKLQQMGYTISSVNDREPDYVEYEIVKGQNSFEVQIDRDPKTQMATKVDVATNVWDAAGTDRVKAANKKK
ncbi:MAG: hypothetical protein ABI537_12015 [Casimicrobiaceae bacterium]